MFLCCRFFVWKIFYITYLIGSLTWLIHSFVSDLCNKILIWCSLVICFLFMHTYVDIFWIRWSYAMMEIIFNHWRILSSLGSFNIASALSFLFVLLMFVVIMWKNKRKLHDWLSYLIATAAIVEVFHEVFLFFALLSFCCENFYIGDLNSL